MKKFNFFWKTWIYSTLILSLVLGIFFGIVGSYDQGFLEQFIGVIILSALIGILAAILIKGFKIKATSASPQVETGNMGGVGVWFVFPKVMKALTVSVGLFLIIFFIIGPAIIVGFFVFGPKLEILYNSYFVKSGRTRELTFTFQEKPLLTAQYPAHYSFTQYYDRVGFASGKIQRDWAVLCWDSSASAMISFSVKDSEWQEKSGAINYPKTAEEFAKFKETFPNYTKKNINGGEFFIFRKAFSDTYWKEYLVAFRGDVTIEIEADIMADYCLSQSHIDAIGTIIDSIKLSDGYRI